MGDYLSKKANGFTLIDMMISLGIFALVISITVGIFVNGSGSQRKIIELYTIQNEGGYLMEVISRELRMATDIGNDQQNNNDSSIEFTNYEGILVTYCRWSKTDGCFAGADNGTYTYLARNGEIISSSNVIIDSLNFYVSASFVNIQPLVTTSMSISANGKYNTNLMLQNSVSMRIYP